MCELELFCQGILELGSAQEVECLAKAVVVEFLVHFGKEIYERFVSGVSVMFPDEEVSIRPQYSSNLSKHCSLVFEVMD